ncbi:MAG: c-type cytochrome [Methylobacter sp.]
MKYKTSFLCLFAGIAALGVSGMANAETHKAKQTIAFSPASTSVVVGGTVVVAATSSSGLNVVLTQDTSTTKYCSFNRNTGLVSGLAVGTCKINATQGGDASYASAKSVLSIPVKQKLAQTISFGTAPKVATGGTGTMTATASSGLPVILASKTPTVCSISGNTVKGLIAGLCTVTADQAGNTTYAPAPQATQSFNISSEKLAQTISFGAVPKISAGSTGTVTASASSGLPVTLTSKTPTVCSVSGNSVTGLIVGTCTIAANQAGNTTYAAAPEATQSFSVSQRVSGSNGGSKLPVTAPFDCSTLASSGNAADDGRRAYNRLNCVSCHGQDGSGGMGPDIRGEGGDVAEAVYGDGAMPSFAGFLCPNDITDLQAYLNSISKTAKYLDWDVSFEQILDGAIAPAPTGVVTGP